MKNEKKHELMANIISKNNSFKPNKKQYILQDVEPKILLTTNHTILPKRGLLLLGGAMSGKSRLANLFIEKKEYVIINCKNINVDNISKFIFSDCNETTEVVVCDDVSVKLINYFSLLCFNGVIVNKKGRESFIINPKFIITSECLIKDVPRSAISSRCDIFELSKCY